MRSRRWGHEYHHKGRDSVHVCCVCIFPEILDRDAAHELVTLLSVEIKTNEKEETTC